MPSVLHLINGEHYAGAERVQDLLGQFLPGHGYDAVFACLKPDQFDRRRHGRDYRVIALPMASRTDLGAVRALRRLLDEERFEILHTHTPRAAVVGRLALCANKLPMVHHAHSPTDECTDSRLRNRLVSFAENLALKRADKLIAVSRNVERYIMRQGLPRESVCMIPNGVPGPQALPDPAAPTDEWTLCVVALFRPRKGLEVLLKSLRQLLDTGQRVRLRAVGSFETPEYEQQVHALARELDLESAIDWTGFCSNVGAELAKAHVMVLPSLYGEGLPMVLLEGMAAGVPVVASAVEGMSEILEDGQAGVLVPPGDAPALADALASLLDEPRQMASLRVRAHARQRSCYSADSMAKGVARAYDELRSVGAATP